jgi:hypothetical protein
MRGFSILSVLVLAVALLVFVPCSSAQTFYTDIVTLRDSSVAVTADSTFKTIDISQAEFVTFSCELVTLGGTGTYCPILMTSLDGVIWDSVRTDTLANAGSNTVWSQSVYTDVYRGAGGNTSMGAETGSVPLTRYFKCTLDEIAASTGSYFTIRMYLRQRAYKDQ